MRPVTLVFCCRGQHGSRIVDTSVGGYRYAGLYKPDVLNSPEESGSTIFNRCFCVLQCHYKCMNWTTGGFPKRKKLHYVPDYVIRVTTLLSAETNKRNSRFLFKNEVISCQG